MDQRLNVVEVTSNFGSYVKFAVKREDEPQPTSSVVLRYAFEIMRKSKQELSHHRLPQRLSERTKKDKLFNDLLKCLKLRSGSGHQMELKVGECFLQLSQMFCGTWTVTMTPYLGGDSRYQNCSHHIKGTMYPKPQSIESAQQQTSAVRN